MIFQNSINYTKYIDEYQELVYKYYSKEYTPYELVYYNVDTINSIIDDEILEGGAYSLIGPKSGWRWNKIYFFPVFFIEPIQSVQYDSQERGVVQEVEMSFVFPDSYGIIPNEQDLLYLPTILNPQSDQNKPMFIVKSIEKDNISQRKFFKCTCKILQYRPEDVENQVSHQFVFVDYIKKILDYNTGTALIEQIDLATQISYELQSFYDKNLNLFHSE